MSFYATLQGFIQFKNHKQLEATVKSLKEKHFMDETGNYFINERNQKMTRNKVVNVEQRRLTIPLGYYRNLSRTLENILSQANGRLIGTSTDGVLLGWIVDNDKATEFDLRKWWIEQGNDESKIPDVDANFQAYCNWQAKAETAFHKANQPW